MSPHDPISHSDDDLTHTGQPPDKRDDLPSTLDPALAQTRRTFDARDKPGPVTADATDAVTPTVPQQTQTDHPAGQLPHDPKTMKMPTNEGTVAIPGYEILGVAGVGGMGIVYKARQLRPNRVVALKMIRSAQDASLEELVRFKIEAEAIADMEHPNIVKLWEVGEYGGLPFFSLEFCAGGSLAQRLKQSLPAPAESAELVETLARAVHYAHSRGVIHRDLKPANVLLQIGSGLPGEAAAPPASRGLFGTPKISDFGLAKRLDVGSEVSRSGHIVGTPAYMSPEQAAGQSSRCRSRGGHLCLRCDSVRVTDQSPAVRGGRAGNTGQGSVATAGAAVEIAEIAARPGDDLPDLPGERTETPLPHGRRTCRRLARYRTGEPITRGRPVD